MGAWGTFDRATALRRLADGTFDVLVVGGGITGAGVALDAASRGLRTALVERDDFASGTSSKSSKLVHGGLRYLQNGEIRLVYEALRERQRLLRNAPHLVKVLPFLIPIFSSDGLINRKLARAMGSAMWMYDLTGGLRIGKLHKRLSTDEAVPYMPTLRADRLASAYLYYDARTDDARLTLTIVRTAVLDHGAVAVNGCRLAAVHKDDAGRVMGATVEADGTPIEVRCGAIVNATGVWADDVRTLDEGIDPNGLRPAKGIHVTVPWEKVQNTIAAVVPVPKDKRSVFVVPWGSSPTAASSSPTSVRPTPTTTARRRSPVHARRHRLRAAGRQRVDYDGHHRGRRARHVGRAPPAGEGGRERADCRPVPAPPGRRRRRAAWSPSPAGSSRPTGRWRRTPSTR